MIIKQLEYFIKVVECKNFFKASEELFITQSSLSKQIQKLEKELDTILFDRSGRSATLTVSGETLYKEAPAFLAHYQGLKNTLSPSNQQLYLTFLPVLDSYSITPYLTAFSKKYPQIDFNLNEKENNEIPTLLHKGIYELGIFRSFQPDDKEWEYLTLCKDKLALIIPKTHPLSDQKKVSLLDFKDEKFILLSDGTQLFEHSISACRKAGFTPKIIYQGGSASTISQMVAEGNGIAIYMNQVAIHQNHPRNAILSFKESKESELILAYRKGHSLSKGAMLFYEYMRAAFPQSKVHVGSESR